MPVQDCCQTVKLIEVNRIPPLLDSRQKQDVLLEIGRQMKQAHNLRDARPADLAEPGQLGVVANRTAANQFIEA